MSPRRSCEAASSQACSEKYTVMMMAAFAYEDPPIGAFAKRSSAHTASYNYMQSGSQGGARVP